MLGPLRGYWGKLEDTGWLGGRLASARGPLCRRGRLLRDASARDDPRPPPRGACRPGAPVSRPDCPPRRPCHAPRHRQVQSRLSKQGAGEGAVHRRSPRRVVGTSRRSVVGFEAPLGCLVFGDAGHLGGRVRRASGRDDQPSRPPDRRWPSCEPGLLGAARWQIPLRGDRRSRGEDEDLVPDGLDRRRGTRFRNLPPSSMPGAGVLSVQRRRGGPHAFRTGTGRARLQEARPRSRPCPAIARPGSAGVRADRPRASLRGRRRRRCSNLFRPA